MINLAASFRLAQAAKRLPPGRKGRPVSPSTLVRWIVHGILGPDGEIVYLEAGRLASRWVTDDAALQRFVERLTPKQGGALSLRSTTDRRGAIDRAERELKERGL